MVTTAFSERQTKKFKRLYVLTGKGGVGKTTLSLAMTGYLREKGINAFYYSFEQDAGSSLPRKIEIPFIKSSPDESLKKYMARKLKSEIIAKAILKTSFFNSLFNILPGIRHLTVLGDILYRLEQDDNLTIVLDAPSTGHALNIFNAPKVFQGIFRKGVLVKDIQEMDFFAHQSDILKTTIVCLPTEMALQEGIDLESKFKTIYQDQIDIVVNNVFGLVSEMKQEKRDSLPWFLHKKIDMESDAIHHFGIEKKLPHIASNDIKEIVYQLIPDMRMLV